MGKSRLRPGPVAAEELRFPGTQAHRPDKSEAQKERATWWLELSGREEGQERPTLKRAGVWAAGGWASQGTGRSHV